MASNTLLDALVQKGVLISVSVRYWRARKKLNPEDIGLSREQIDDRLISLGHKRLVPADSLKRLALLEGRAHALVEENTFPFLNGVARYLPNAKLEQVTAKLRGIESEFDAEQQDFIGRYAALRRAAVGEWEQAARSLVNDPARLLAVIEQAFPPDDRLPRYFGFDIRMFQISVPDVLQAELVELGTQRELIEARRQAAQAARAEIDSSCRSFIADCVASLREQTAKLCGEMLETIHSTGNVHQKTLNRLVRFIEQFRELNFADDTEMEARLEAVRSQLLERPAAEYRDSAHFRRQLTDGLTRLRETAAEMAQADAGELVDSFGRIGQRKFTLAA